MRFFKAPSVSGQVLWRYREGVNIAHTTLWKRRIFLMIYTCDFLDDISSTDCEHHFSLSNSSTESDSVSNWPKTLTGIWWQVLSLKVTSIICRVVISFGPDHLPAAVQRIGLCPHRTLEVDLDITLRSNTRRLQEPLIFCLLFSTMETSGRYMKTVISMHGCTSSRSPCTVKRMNSKKKPLVLTFFCKSENFS